VTRPTCFKPVTCSRELSSSGKKALHYCTCPVFTLIFSLDASMNHTRQPYVPPRIIMHLFVIRKRHGTQLDLLISTLSGSRGSFV
jgi:hypothetical protein